nr:immunoglobulin heavy chain junction region [Homo sapiens]
TVRTSSLST